MVTSLRTYSSININMLEAERARRDFKLFVKLAWHVIEPGKPFVSGWHLDAIAEHLQAVASGDIKRLLVNMPPRHGKSTLISVLWSGWLLLQDASTQILCASYAQDLATRDNVKARRLIKSNWYQQRYGHIFTLQGDQDAKMKFETSSMGYRMVTYVGGGTGDGGDILILDDPHNIKEKESDVKRESALDWVDNTWSTRLNDQRTGKMVVVGQRVHENDVSGHILENNEGGEWVHLNLPAEYESGSPCRTYLPSGKELWADPRTKDGELLWTERFPQMVIDRAKRTHGPMDYAALYQQRPTPAGGAIFKSRNQRYFTIDQTTQCYLLETPRGIKPISFDDCWRFCTADLAISEKQSADWTVFAAYAVTPYKDLLLLDIVRDRFPFDEQLDQLSMFHQKHNFTFAAIESVAYQLAMVQAAILRGLPAQPYHPPSDKVTRSSTAAIWDANGKSYNHKNAVWLFEYEKEKFTFPKAPKDDQVDTHSLAAIVVCTQHRPGVLSDDKKANVDYTLSLEMIVDAAAIAKEQAEQEAKDKEQEKATYNPIEVINPFEWASFHEGGDW